MPIPCYRRVALNVSAGLLFGLLVIGFAGCESGDQVVTRKNNLGPVGPEESFDRILQRVRRRLDRGPRQSISPGLKEDANETSTFSFQDKVSGAVIKPDEEDEPYRARIIIETHSDYVFTQAEPETSDSQEEDKGGSLLSLLDEDGTGAPGDDAVLPPEMDPDADTPVGSLPSGNGSKPETGESARTRPQTIRAPAYESKTKYDLIYREGRWVLETALEKDSSIERIFEYALEGQ